MANIDLSDLDPELGIEKPYLPDVLDFARDIAPYRVLHLYAGVGAGKNTLIEMIK